MPTSRTDLWATRIDEKYRARVPRVVVDERGVKWRVSEGHRPDRLRVDEFQGEDRLRQLAGAEPEHRLRDMDRDGIDAEVIFPNKGLAMWATPDAAFAMAQCRVYNEWAWETFGPHNDRMSPAAALATGDLDGSIAEVQRVAALGFRALTLPCKPIWGAHDIDHPNYNLPAMDPLWAAIQDAGLPITFHVSTGRDPRASRGNGGAVINYVSHSLSPTIEPRGQPLRVGSAGPLPPAPLRHHRGRHRMGPVAPRRHGRGLPQAPHVGAAAAQEAAERVLPRTRVRVIPGGPGRTGPGRADGPRRLLHVGRTTTRTTRAPGPTRPRPSSAPWATSRMPHGPRSSG